jgi:pimeloyl-ACP methyl ester carboxylesterase
MMTEPHNPSGPAGPTAPVAEREITFPSAAGDVVLAGSLIAPTAGPAVPAVVLVAGTGPIDRDVTFCGHALFKVLAVALARAGIASLRFDKRGVGQSQGDFQAAGPDEFAADVRGAAGYLATQRGISSGQLGLLGHSEGGMVALTAAADLPWLGFCVLLASPLLSGKENFVHAFALLARGGLDRDSRFDRHVADLTTLLRIARSAERPESDPNALRLAETLAPRIVSERTSVMFGKSSLSGAGFLGMLSSSCLNVCLSWDPARIVPRVACPALLVYGGRDLQAPAEENAAAARALLDRLDKPSWSIREFPGMNHVFQRCTTGMPDEYGAIDRVMDDEVIGEVARWITTTCRDDHRQGSA